MIFCQYFSFIISLAVYICHNYYSQQKINVKVQQKQLRTYLFNATLKSWLKKGYTCQSKRNDNTEIACNSN